MIVDTSFVIDLMQGDPDALATLEELEDGSESLHVPSLVFYELWEGIQRSDEPLRERDEVQAVLEAHPGLDLTPAAARRAGRLSGDLIERGEMLDDVDVLLAGMALEEGRGIVTRDGDDFERVDGVEVEGY